MYGFKGVNKPVLEEMAIKLNLDTADVNTVEEYREVLTRYKGYDFAKKTLMPKAKNI